MTVPEYNGPPNSRPRSDKVLVTVVIPCWNGEAFIGEAIESALAQTYPNVEVIVIDDGSTDGSLDVIRSFGRRVRWESGPNRGACAARNRGMALALGELIQFLDADDVLLPAKLARMVPVALARGREAMPVCDWEVERSDREVQRLTLNYRGEDPVLFCLAGQLPTPSPLHWRENLDCVGGFDETLPCSQERDLHLRLACTGLELEHVPEVLYRVRRQPGSLSADTVRVLRQRLSVFQAAFAGLQSSGALTEERRRAFGRTVAGDARNLIRRGDVTAGRTAFASALAMSADGAYAAFNHRMLRRSARLIGPVAAERMSRTALALGLTP